MNRRQRVNAALLKLSKETEAQRKRWHLVRNRITSQQELNDLGYEPVGTHRRGAFGAASPQPGRDLPPS